MMMMIMMMMMMMMISVVLEKIFRDLGFVVECHDDLEAQQMETTLGGVASRDHSPYDCLVCCVMSHGDHGVVYGVDDKSVSVDTLRSFFKPATYPGLTGKPKLFFIQACQGHDQQRGQSVFRLQLNPFTAMETERIRIPVC
jgi:hypothetical protein